MNQHVGGYADAMFFPKCDFFFLKKSTIDPLGFELRIS